MLEGKVSSAMKWISSRTSENGALIDINEKVLNQLRQKHPSAKPAEEDHLLQGPIFQHDPIRFEEINEDSIYDAAKSLNGSAGPSGLNADGLKRILCSKSFGKKSEELRYKVAQIARRLCTDEIEPGHLQSFTASRLVPLSKDGGNGVRPIGIGEVLRRVIAKSVMRLLKLDVIEGSGSLQVCSGQQSGCEL
jgi:hypothetical protein